MSSSWQPSASLSNLRLRAEMLAAVRRFFADRGVMEVDTPMLSSFASTDPHLHSLSSEPQAAGHRMYWHTSPEFPMKRLLAAGSGSIYQICHVFRDGEAGRLHNLEFTLLEWYRPGWDQWALMDEIAALVHEMLSQRLVLAEPEHVSYQQLWRRQLGVDPLTCNEMRLQKILTDAGFDTRELTAQIDRDGWLDLVMSHCLGPKLGHDRCCFVHGYPASQAALAQLDPNDTRTAARFELYLKGIELANGYLELTDPLEHTKRFEADNLIRRRRGLPMMPADRHLLAALRARIPDCAGVALGFDRLLMLAAEASHIEEVIAFPLARA